MLTEKISFEAAVHHGLLTLSNDLDTVTLTCSWGTIEITGGDVTLSGSIRGAWEKIQEKLVADRQAKRAKEDKPC